MDEDVVQIIIYINKMGPISKRYQPRYTIIYLDVGICSIWYGSFSKLKDLCWALVNPTTGYCSKLPQTIEPFRVVSSTCILSKTLASSSPYLDGTKNTGQLHINSTAKTAHLNHKFLRYLRNLYTRLYPQAHPFAYSQTNLAIIHHIYKCISCCSLQSPCLFV